MKASLYIFTLVVTCGAIVFTLAQKRSFEGVQKDRIQLIAEIKTLSADASVKEKELADEKKLIADLEIKREEVTQSVAALEATGSMLKRDTADLEKNLKAQQQEMEELDQSLAEVNKVVAGLGGDVSVANLGDKLQAFDADKVAKQASLDEKETLMAAADKSLTNNRAEADRFAKRVIERNAHLARNAMEAVVTAVDQEWGFLVIGAGSNSGFTPQTGLLVQRDGRLIGRVRPSSIELNQTIAEIDFKSLAAGVRLQPGDRVMLATSSTN